MPALSLQQVLPHYDVNEIHAVAINASPERVYAALTQYHMGDSPVVKVLFGLRQLPKWLTQGRPASPRSSEPNFIEALARAGFVKLADQPNVEIVVGLIGKFWQPSPDTPRLADGDAFLNFADPMYAKAAMNILLTPLNAGHTRLSTETRVHVPDPANRRKFRFYWAIIGLFSGWIRMDMLQRIKRLAEAQ
jgi:hypothetical protein